MKGEPEIRGTWSRVRWLLSAIETEGCPLSRANNCGRFQCTEQFFSMERPGVGESYHHEGRPLC
jgi:hypothetical protein